MIFSRQRKAAGEWLVRTQLIHVMAFLSHMIKMAYSVQFSQRKLEHELRVCI